MFYSADGVSGWSEVSKLVASDGTYDDFFGSSVSVWSNAIVVGATYGDTPAGSGAGERMICIVSLFRLPECVCVIYAFFSIDKPYLLVVFNVAALIDECFCTQA